MQYLEYKSAVTDYTADVRRMKASLVQAGYMASENDIERLWDDYSRARSTSWEELPSNSADLMLILLTGFGLRSVPMGDDEYLWPRHWLRDGY
ncbi:hypothetical protein D3C77_333260 [compost metagenome]